MKNGKKFLFVMAASVLALITGCQNNSSSTSSSSEIVTSSQVTTSEVSTSEASSTTSETPTTSEVSSSVEESTVSSVDSTTSEASSSEVTSSDATSSEATSSGVASSEVTSNSSSETSSSEEHVHAYGNWEIVKKPTLTEAGTAKRTCECNDVDVIRIPALNDTEVWKVKSTTLADHFKGGVTIYESVYGEVPVTSLKEDHVFGAWNIVTEPTLTTGGKAERVCSSDGFKEEVNLPILSDTTVWSVKSEEPATHSADGTKIYTSKYGEVPVVLPKGEHTYGSWTITIEPTETVGGKAKHVCSSDDFEETIDIPALLDASVWKVESFPGATHADEGKKVYTSIYGKVEIKIPAGEHVYGAWKITTEPTATATGKAEKACTVTGCTHVEEVTLPALNDTTVWTAVVTEPTHTKAGYTTYTSVYGEVVVQGEPATGHTEYGDWTLVDEPTTTVTGSATRTCSCGYVDEVEVPVLTDTTVWTAVVTEPTHTEAGYTTYKSVYGELVVNGEPATGHTASGKYTAVTEDGVVSIYEVCEDDDGGYVGDAVNTMNATAIAEYEVDLSRSHPFVQDEEDPKKWISAEINNSSFSYIILRITKGGFFRIDFGVSSEKSDKLYINNVQHDGSGDESYKTGVFEKNVSEGEEIVIYYKKDSGGVKGNDQAYIILQNITFTYHVAMFDSNGGSAVTPSFIENGSIIGDLPIPTQEGKYFEGWFTNADCTTAYNGEKLSGDTTLYAKWSNAQTVTFHTNGGESIDDVAFQIGTTPVMPEDPVREGYYFLGWYTDEEFTEKYVSENKEASFDLYAKWIAEKDAHALYGNYAGFKFQLSKSFSASTSYAELAVDVEGNFALHKTWSGYVNGTFGAVIDGKVSNETVGIANVYEDGNVIIMSDTKTISSSTYLFVLIKDAAASTTGVKGKCCDEGKFAFVTFSFNSKDITIMVDRANGVVYYDVSIKGENGNSISISDIDKNLFFTVYKGDTLIKHMHYKKYKVNHEEEMGYDEIEDYFSLNDAYYGLYTLDANSLVLSGAGFAKFSVIGSSIYSYEVVETNVVYVYHSTSDRYYRYLITLDTENKTFTYVERKVDVTFNFGYEVDSVEKTVSTKFLYDVNTYFPDDVKNPTREGYIFKGWYDNEDCEGDASSTYVNLKVNTTYYAKWVEAISLTVYNNNGSEDPVVSYFEKGTTPELISPTKDGHLFVGWYTNEGLTEQYVPENKATNVVVYAKWEEAPFWVGDYYGINLGHSGDGLANDNPNGYYWKFNCSDYSAIYGSGTKIYAQGTWSKDMYNPITRNIPVYGTSNYLFHIETASDGQVIAFYDGDTSRFCDDDCYIYVKTTDSSNISTKTVYFNNGCQKLVELTIGTKKYYIYMDGYNIYLSKSGGNEAYLDVTFKDANGNLVSFDNLYDSTNKKFIDYVKVLHNDTVLREFKVVNSSVVRNDGRAGTYSGSVNGKNSSVVLDGYGNATINAEGVEPVLATYAFDSEGKLVLTINSKEYKFSVGEGNALTQILDGFEGSYSTDIEGKTLVITGYGVCSIGETSGTYTIDENMVVVTINDVVSYYLLNREEDTATKLSYKITNGGSAYNIYSFKYTGTQWESTNTDENSTKSVIKITAFSSVNIEIVYWASSEAENKWDYFHIDLNGEKVGYSGGKNTTAASAKEYTVTLKAGDKLELIYEKDGSSFGGSDKAYITSLKIDGNEVTSI